MEALAVRRPNIGGAQRELAAVRHGVTCIDREVDDHLLELGNVGAHRPQLALARRDVERDPLADQALQQHAQVLDHVGDVEHLRTQRLLA